MSGPQRVLIVSFALELYCTPYFQAQGMEKGLSAEHASTVSSSLSSWGTSNQDRDQGTYALETGDDKAQVRTNY